jgi:hypothetical protein
MLRGLSKYFENIVEKYKNLIDNEISQPLE